MLARFLTCAVVLVLAMGCNAEPQPATPPQGAVPPVPQPPGPSAPAAPVRQESASPVPYKGPLPALPSPGYDAPRPAETVRAVYEFAARRPDVLHYVPCFCGCERAGHVGNDDCFVKSRNASGTPEWDVHGYS